MLLLRPAPLDLPKLFAFLLFLSSSLSDSFYRYLSLFFFLSFFLSHTFSFSFPLILRYLNRFNFSHNLNQDEHNNNAPTAFETDCDDDNNALHHRGSEPEPEPELEPVDIFDKTICIHCDNKREEAEGVLICGGRGCPVAVHATCLGFQP